MVVSVPEKTDRAHNPPPRYFTCSKMMLRAGLRFPLTSELGEIFNKFEVALTQFSYKALMVIIGLAVFFRERGTSLSFKGLCGLCKFSGDNLGRVGFRPMRNGIHFFVPSASKVWSNNFFFVKNEWKLQEGWKRLRDLRSLPGMGENEILKLLNISNRNVLEVELLNMYKLVDEERLFKARMSVHIGRTHAAPLKRSNRPVDDEDAPTLKKRSSVPKKLSDNSTLEKESDKSSKTSNGGVRLPHIRIPEEVLKHLCTGRQKAEEKVSKAMESIADLSSALDEWNSEYVRTKYLRSEYEKKWHAEVKSTTVLGDELAQCRTELATMATTLSVQRQAMDRSQEELVEVRADVLEKEKRNKELIAEKKALREERDKLRKEISEKESIHSDDRMAAISQKAVDDFKKSSAFRRIIEDEIQKARDYLIAVELKKAEKDSLEEGFTRGFLKATRLVHRKTGVDLEGISINEVSEDPVVVSDGEDFESVLRDVLDSDDDDFDA